MSDNALVLSQTQNLAKKLELEAANPQDLVQVMKATAFKGNVSDAQMTALLAVANQYRLNPWTKEIYAFPDKSNGIVPVVGVDGWSRIINSHPQFDGMDFEQDSEGCTCIIYRKDRSHPVRVTEYMAECKRNTDPWKSHPRRMLRHKAMIQCARLAFGFVGIYEQDEAERIVEAESIRVTASPAQPATLPQYPDDRFTANFQSWREGIQSGKTTAEKVINTVSTIYALTEGQEQAIRDCEAIEAEYTEAEGAAQ